MRVNLLKAIASGLRRFKRAAADRGAAWRLVVDGTELASLRDPRVADTSWTSFAIVASTTPPDPRLRDDAFWLHADWKLVDARSGREAPNAIASASGLRDGGRRITLRGAQLD